MMLQPDLFPDTLPPIIAIESRQAESTADRFHRFHEANPHVYQILKSLSLRMKARGLERWSVKAAFEVVRFMSIETQSDEYRLDNNFAPHYSRMLMDRVPDLAGFFHTRTIRSRK